MGLIDRIFGRPKEPKGQAARFETFTAYSPQFMSWNGRLYESELVRAAVDAHARHIGKLKYSMNGTARQKLYTATKSAPNPWYTWSQFLERCSNIYQIENNLFVVPLLDRTDDVCGFFPVIPSQCEVIEKGGRAFLRFSFIGGQKRAIELDRVAIVPKHQLKDDFFGERNTALNGTMELVNMVNQGIAEGAKNSASYRFMARMNSPTFDEDLAKERQRFDRLNFSAGEGGGLLLFNNTMTDVKELSQRGYTVNPEQLKLIQGNVVDYFGVPLSVIRNEATADVMDAFFNGAIEPFAIKLSEALTRIVFTERERNSGNEIIFAANRLQYMSVGSKIDMTKELGDRGAIMIDEIRELFNYPPLPDGAGQHAPIRGEYYMVDKGKQDDQQEGEDDAE